MILGFLCIAILDQRSVPLEPSVIPAIQRQVSEHFAPAWHVNAHLYTATAPKADDWYVILTDATDPTAFGRHGVDEDGRPFATVYADGDSVTLSHEILEMLADPWVNRWTLVRHSWNLFEGDLYKQEVADAVSGSTYLIDGVRVSDFLLPNYFRSGSRGPWDYMSILTGPLSNTPTGNLPSISIWNMSR